MRTLALIAAAVLLAGCGSSGAGEEAGGGTGTKDTTTAREGSATVGSCTADSPEVNGATQLAEVDLDGDGTPEPVRITGGQGECPYTLFTARGEGFLSVELGDDGPPVTQAYAVDLPGREGQLLVTTEEHPRGGFQTRVFAADDDQLAELEVDGHSLVPFVATDVPERPISVDCTEGGIEITEAVTRLPQGRIPSWDVKRTTYAVDGTTVTAGATTDVADNVGDKQLTARFPALAEKAHFTSCRAG